MASTASSDRKTCDGMASRNLVGVCRSSITTSSRLFGHRLGENNIQRCPVLFLQHQPRSRAEPTNRLKGSRQIREDECVQYKKLPKAPTHRHVCSVTGSKGGQTPSVVLSLFQSGRVGLYTSQGLQISNTGSNQLVTYSSYTINAFSHNIHAFMTDHTVTIQTDQINAEHKEAQLGSSRSNLTFSAKKIQKRRFLCFCNNMPIVYLMCN